MRVGQTSDLPSFPLHTAGHSQRGSQCCQHCHDDLYHRLPKFFVLHTLLLLCKQQLFLTNHEGRRARERQREGLARRAEGESQRSGNFTNFTNFWLTPYMFFFKQKLSKIIQKLIRLIRGFKNICLIRAICGRK